MQELKKDIDLIDFIVSERKKQGVEMETQNKENKQVLNAENVFISSANPKGLFAKEIYKSVFQTFSADSLKALKALYNAMANKEKISTTPFPRVDKKGVPYYWISLLGKNGKQEFKLPIFEGLDRLISAYLFDMFIFELDFDSMYHESVK